MDSAQPPHEPALPHHQHLSLECSTVSQPFPSLATAHTAPKVTPESDHVKSLSKATSAFASHSMKAGAPRMIEKLSVIP